MKIDSTIKLGDWLKFGGAVVAMAVAWGTTRSDIQYLRRDVDNMQKTEEKLASGFDELSRSQAVLTAILQEREKVSLRIHSPHDSGQ